MCNITILYTTLDNGHPQLKTHLGFLNRGLPKYPGLTLPAKIKPSIWIRYSQHMAQSNPCTSTKLLNRDLLQVLGL